MNTNKPLSEWTLGEVKAECEKHTAHCVGCPLWTDAAGCRLDTSCYRDNDPKRWDLSEPPRWTDDEIKFAEIFKLACKNEIFFERLKGSQILLWGEVGIDPTANAVLPYKLLPSLKEGERVTLDEIIGGAE